MEDRFEFEEDMNREELVDDMVEEEFSNVVDNEDDEFAEYYDSGDDDYDDFDVDILTPEEDFVYSCYEDFEPQIIDRGEDYYERKKVLNCVKDGERKYIAKVQGSNDRVYEVVVYNTGFGVEHYCDCPYEEACKHSYAVLKAISNKEYRKVSLKEDVNYKVMDIREIMYNIPADDLKSYLLEVSATDNGVIDLDDFEDRFKKYYPKQGYNYYYNNLYNAIVLGNCFDCMIDCYLEDVKEYISNDEFNEAYLIVKGIIESYHDAENINDSYLIEKIPALGMYLRIIYRKADDKLRDNMTIWLLKLKLSLYYENYYLEDMVLSIN